MKLDDMFVESVALKFLSHVEFGVSRLENLREVNLNGYPIDRINPLNEIQDALPHVVQLDLSETLLSQFAEIAQLCKCLPSLNTLSLKYACGCICPTKMKSESKSSSRFCIIV
jgi:hypothetical protein